MDPLRSIVGEAPYLVKAAAWFLEESHIEFRRGRTLTLRFPIPRHSTHNVITFLYDAQVLVFLFAGGSVTDYIVRIRSRCCTMMCAGSRPACHGNARSLIW